MRHGKKDNHLGRTKAHRSALLRNLAIALITHKRITTTLAKAKALRIFIEPLVTKSRDNTTHSRRTVFSYLQNKEAVQEMFGPIAAKVGDRPGGYVRVLHTGFRKGDAAEMAMIELVDFNEIYSAGKDSAAQKEGGKKRSRRGGKGGAGKAAVADTVVETITAPVAEVVEDAVEVVETAGDEVAEATDAAATEENNEEQK
ncbi:MAG: 50S ribosomal protein L17 [Saprospiraceae bacterium]|jgi:large subunit ribosomal protein L17|nr:50S ribosomal protein L17 [Saprospiraceae bacterium]